MIPILAASYVIVMSDRVIGVGLTKAELVEAGFDKLSLRKNCYFVYVLSFIFDWKRGKCNRVKVNVPLCLP